MPVISAEPETVSLATSELAPAGLSLTPARLGDPGQADDKRIQDGLAAAQKLSETVRTFCRTAERERRIDLLAVMRQEARSLRESLLGGELQSVGKLHRRAGTIVHRVVKGRRRDKWLHAEDGLSRDRFSDQGRFLQLRS